MDTGTRMAGSEGGDRLIAASRVRGTDVYDSSGEKIGSIDDIMIGKMDGEVAFAVMSFGGFLGIGEKYHPLPWDALDYDTDLGGYKVGTAGENFRDAPSYSKDDLGNDDSWSDDIESYYSDASSGGWLSRRRRSGQGDQPGGWRQEGDVRGRQEGTSFDRSQPGHGSGGVRGTHEGAGAGNMPGGMGAGTSGTGAGAAGGGVSPGIGGGAATSGIPLGDRSRETVGGGTGSGVDDDRTAPYGDPSRSEVNR